MVEKKEVLNSHPLLPPQKNKKQKTAVLRVKKKKRFRPDEHLLNSMTLCVDKKYITKIYILSKKQTMLGSSSLCWEALHPS